MKTRFGFVSNSSSTSFCIYGICISERERFLDAFNQAHGGEEPVDDFYDVRYALPEGTTGLSVYSGDYGTYIGMHPASIRDDETGRQFKDRVEATLKELFPGMDFEAEYIEESIYS